MKRILLGFVLALALAATANAQGVGTFFIKSAPGAAAQATATQAAAASGVRYVADCLTATLVAGATAPAAQTFNVLIRDGASGSGTVLATWAMSIPATAGASAAPVVVCPAGGIVSGSAATAMTVEFSAAAGANTIQTVTLKGHRERF